MTERTIMTVFTAAVGASWVYYFALYSGASILWRWLALPVAALLGALTWRRYSGGHRTETAFAEEVPPYLRIGACASMTLAGFIGGFVAPVTFGVKDASFALELAIGSTLAAIWGWIAWHHPTLFYKDRRF